jgi:hypothetical protein
MRSPPKPDRLIGPVKYRPPKGKPEDRPLQRLRREFAVHRTSQRKKQRAQRSKA